MTDKRGPIVLDTWHDTVDYRLIVTRDRGVDGLTEWRTGVFLLLEVARSKDGMGEPVWEPVEDFWAAVRRLGQWANEKKMKEKSEDG